jgi:hypothetical protein
VAFLRRPRKSGAGWANRPPLENPDRGGIVAGGRPAPHILE